MPLAVVVTLEAELTEDAGQLHVAPVADPAHLARDVRPLLGVGQAGREVGVDLPDLACVDVVARLLDRHSGVKVRPVRDYVAELRRTHEHHPGRSPVVDRVGEQVAVHEEGVGLAAEDRTPTPVGVAQAEGRLSGVDAGAEEVELELGLIGPIAGHPAGLGAEAGLFDRDGALAIRAEGAVLGGDFRGPESVIPRGIDAVEVVDVVDLAEAVDLELVAAGAS